jgi:hypothetical protein
MRKLFYVDTSALKRYNYPNKGNDREQVDYNFS